MRLGVLVCRLCPIPTSQLARSNPVDESAEKLEYDTYGWWRFQSDMEGVRRPGRQWAAFEVLALLDECADKIQAYEDAVAGKRAPFGPAA